jgi:hypothetical protein
MPLLFLIDSNISTGGSSVQGALQIPIDKDIDPDSDILRNLGHTVRYGTDMCRDMRCASDCLEGVLAGKLNGRRAPEHPTEIEE